MHKVIPYHMSDLCCLPFFSKSFVWWRKLLCTARGFGLLVMFVLSDRPVTSCLLLLLCWLRTCSESQSCWADLWCQSNHTQAAAVLIAAAQLWHQHSCNWLACICKEALNVVFSYLGHVSQCNVNVRYEWSSTLLLFSWAQSLLSYMTRHVIHFVGAFLQSSICKALSHQFWLFDIWNADASLTCDPPTHHYRTPGT